MRKTYRVWFSDGCQTDFDVDSDKDACEKAEKDAVILKGTVVRIAEVSVSRVEVFREVFLATQAEFPAGATANEVTDTDRIRHLRLLVGLASILLTRYGKDQAFRRSAQLIIDARTQVDLAQAIKAIE